MHSYHYAPNWTIWIPFNHQTFTDKGKNQYISLNVQIFFQSNFGEQKKSNTTVQKKSMRTAKQKGKSEKMGSELEGSHFFPKLNIFLRSLKQLKNIGENGVEKKIRRLLPSTSIMMMAVTWCLKLPGTGVQW